MTGVGEWEIFSVPLHEFFRKSMTGNMDIGPSGLADASGRELYEHYRFKAEAGQAPQRVDRFVMARVDNLSRTRLQQAARQGGVRVNGNAVRSNYRVKPADEVSVWLDTPAGALAVTPQELPLGIVYEDEAVMVVDKPAGMVVHPATGNHDGTLLNALAWHFRDDPDFDVADPRLGLVHRIDKDSSGLLVIAKTLQAKTHLTEQFFYKTTRRRYVAVAWGRVPGPAGTITGNIAHDPHDPLRMAVTDVEDEGKHAVTHYRVLEAFAYATVVECVLETGRQHQIRVHFQHQGHPLFGDSRYGGDRVLRGRDTAAYREFARRCLEACPRQALHAHTLGFVHPVTGREMDFESPLPADMQALIGLWRGFSDVEC